MEDIKIGFVNAGKGVNKKRGLIQDLLWSRNIYLLGLAETSIQQPCQFKIPGYVTYSAAGLTKQKGTMILIRSSLPSREHPLPPQTQHDNTEAIAIDTIIDKRSITFIVVYSPPRSPVPCALINYVASLQNHYIIAGDFNARHIVYGDTTTSTKGSAFENIITATPTLYRLFSTSHTFVGWSGCSQPDHILASTSLATHLSDVQVEDSITSDHLPITTILRTGTRYRDTNTHTIVDWKHTNWEEFNTILDSSLNSIPTPDSTDQIDAAVDSLSTAFKKAKDKAVPKKEINPSRPTLPAEV